MNKRNYSNVSCADIPKSIFAFDAQTDTQLLALAKIIEQKCFLWPDVLSEMFQLKVTAISETEFSIYCPSCNKPNAIHLIFNRGSQPEYFCECRIQAKRGRSLIEAIQLFMNIPRSEILRLIKLFIDKRISDTKMPTRQAYGTAKQKREAGICSLSPTKKKQC